MDGQVFRIDCREIGRHVIIVVDKVVEQITIATAILRCWAIGWQRSLGDERWRWERR